MRRMCAFFKVRIGGELNWRGALSLREGAVLQRGRRAKTAALGAPRQAVRQKALRSAPGRLPGGPASLASKPPGAPAFRSCGRRGPVTSLRREQKERGSASAAASLKGSRVGGRRGRLQDRAGVAEARVKLLFQPSRSLPGEEGKAQFLL